MYLWTKCEYVNDQPIGYLSNYNELDIVNLPFQS